MPEVRFTVKMPDGVTHECYSPSTAVLRHFATGERMTVAEFVSRSRRAFAEASERVRLRYGYACPSAALQLAQIEDWTRGEAPGGPVEIVSI